MFIEKGPVRAASPIDASRRTTRPAAAATEPASPAAPTLGYLAGDDDR